MPTLKRFFITFPQKIPALAGRYVVIPDYEEEAARQTAYREYKNHWAFIYDNEEEFLSQKERFGLLEITEPRAKEAIAAYLKTAKIRDTALYLVKSSRRAD